MLAAFPEKLKESQRVPDNLAYLGELALEPTCSIVKLPNISAPLNQLQDCIAELRGKGYDVPLYPVEVTCDAEAETQERYAKIMGSAVNPVLREGNSDRRVALPVKAYAQKNPHGMMRMWSKASRSHVATMTSGDFYESEKSAVMEKDTAVTIELEKDNGETVVLKEEVALEAGEVIDGSFISIKALKEFYEQEINEAKEAEILFSLHLKATMMKVSDPILFGHCIKVFFKDAYNKHQETLENIGANPNQGLAAMFEVMDNKLSTEEAAAIKADFEACYEDRPWLAMVNSDKVRSP